ALISKFGSGAVVVDADRSVHPIGTVPAVDLPARTVALAAGASAWPGGNQVTVSLELKRQQGRRTHRPYVAVWIENANGKVVRTVTVWGNDPKYLKDLSAWSKVVGRNP